MTTFEDLYFSLLEDEVNGKEIKESAKDNNQLDCLLHPEKYAPVWKIKACKCDEKEDKCSTVCLFNAITRDENGDIAINPDKCTGCSVCIDVCKSQALVASKDILPALYAVKHAKGPVYALIAPAFLGQFSADVTPGKLRSAFSELGFDGMVEVALFADILTLKEALEFDRSINTENDFQLTSCCCPIWIAMIRKIYHELMPHVPGAVSPMIAAGRAVKHLHPDALTIFVGPCMAKKAEAKEEDLKGAVDFVLTFQEIQDVFDVANIKPVQLEETDKDHSSRAGRIYARAGGVSEAVKSTVERLKPDRTIHVNTRNADGVSACREMIELLKRGETTENFFEGMGCKGGCVGGPKAVLDRNEGRENVIRYGEEAAYQTPLDNPYVLEMLKRLGFETVEEFLENSDIFIRHFD